MKRSNYYFFIVVIAAFTLLVSACGSNETNESKSEGQDSSKGDAEQVLNLIETAEIPTGDPSVASDAASFTVFGQTMEGLYALDKNDTPVPAISVGKPKISEDGKHYTFQLRKDARWSNGDPVTANDFVFAWRRAVDPNTGSEYAGIFSGVIKNASEVISGDAKPEELGVEADGDYTLKVDLEQPVEYFDSLLAFGTFLPLNEKFVKEKGEKFGTNSDNMLANGPFVLTDWDGTGLTWSYEPNGHYYDKDNISLKKVNVQVAKTPNTAINLYQTGKADRTSPLSSEYAKQYKTNKDASTFQEGSSWYLKFNQKRDGKDAPLANKNLRKAIAMAFDKKSFTDVVLADGSKPLDGYISAGLAKHPETGKDFRKENGDLISYNVEEAKKYWEKGMKEIGKKELKLDYLSDDSENAKVTSEYFQGQLEKNLKGLKVEVQNVPFKVRLQKTIDQDFDIVMHGWGPDYLDPMTFLDLYEAKGSTSHTSNTSYHSKKYDKLINDARVTYANDPAKRWKTMLDAEKLLVQEDTVIAPIYQKGRLVLLKPYVKNFEEHLFGPNYTFKNVKIEK